MLAQEVHKKLNFIHIGGMAMRTNIDIDDELMLLAMRCSDAPSKKATVETALRLLVATRAQAGIRRLKGKVRWEGNLAKSRRSRVNE